MQQVRTVDARELHRKIQGSYWSLSLSFHMRDKATTIQEYFFETYRITLQYPDSFGVRLSGSNVPFAVIVLF